MISDQYVASSGKAALFEKVSFYNDLATDMFKYSNTVGFLLA